MTPPARQVFHVLAAGTLWQEVSGGPKDGRGDLRFVAPFDDQPQALAEARRLGSIAAPATIYVVGVDGDRAEVIDIPAVG